MRYSTARMLGACTLAVAAVSIDSAALHSRCRTGIRWDLEQCCELGTNVIRAEWSGLQRRVCEPSTVTWRPFRRSTCSPQTVRDCAPSRSRRPRGSGAHRKAAQESCVSLPLWASILRAGADISPNRFRVSLPVERGCRAVRCCRPARPGSGRP
jgi:hypothetical protein